MKNNEKGFVVEGALVISLLIGMVVLFVPNPVSSTLGIGQRPNKTILKENAYEKVEILKDEKTGAPVLAADGAYLVKRTGGSMNSDVDKQQKIGFFESLVSLPRLFLIFIILGALGVPGFAWVGALYKDLKKVLKKNQDETKRIVKAMDVAFDTIPLTLAGASLPGEVDRVALAMKLKEGMLSKLSSSYDQSTKDLVAAYRRA